MTTHDHHRHDPESPPAELEPIASRLDALARDDRGAAPQDLASRLARAGIEAEPASVIARIGFAKRTLRIAAAFALIALAGFGAYLLTRPVPTSTNEFEGLANDAAEAVEDLFADAGSAGSESSPSFWTPAGYADTDGGVAGASLWSVADDLDDDTWFNEEDAL